MDERRWRRYLDALARHGHEPLAPSGHRGNADLPVSHPHIDWLADCDRILDLRPGIGLAVRYLARGGARPEGLLPASAIAAAREAAPDCRFLAGDMHDIPASDLVYCGVLAWGALEHALSPPIILCEANRVLRPAGKLLLYVAGPAAIEGRGHIWVPSRRQTLWLLERTGFIVDQIEAAGNGLVYRAIKVGDPLGRD